ncbi:MAG TPA: GAF domain-containing protein [Candidatus Sulfotelmatobacter sp.]
MAKEIVSDEKEKPVLNEEILGKLLEAAYVLQQHNRAQERVDLSLEMQSEQLREQQQADRLSARLSEIQSSGPAPSSHPEAGPPDYTVTLAQIVETQHQIQLRQLDLENSLEMALDRLIDITKGSGAAVGILEGNILRYRGGVGESALPLDSRVEKERALCFECIRSGQVVRYGNVSADFLIDVEECRRRGIQSLIVVPVYHDGGVAGALELYFAKADAFQAHDIHSCQLMAGLVTEALARDEELTWKKSLAEERTVMIEALEKIKPSLAALASEQSHSLGAGAAIAPAESYSCTSCGEELVTGEQYCGKCGLPRPSDQPTVSMQSKLAPSWSSQHPEKEIPAANVGTVPHFSGNQTGLQIHGASNMAGPQSVASPHSASSTGSEEKTDSIARRPIAPFTTEDGLAWSSAAKAKDFLEQLAAEEKESGFARFWSARRGDIYLAVAVILVAIVIRWGIWSEHSMSPGSATNSSAARNASGDPTAGLSLVDKMLISLGLADPPETPEYRGNPETQVWVDLHTALYYCPGTDLYGKTPKGRFASQRDAQLDQFEPAYRKACE